MAEAATFGNIVNILLDVRANYHEQMKSIPQYEAFLLIESSTEKAADALQGSDSSSSIAADVIDSLQFARNRFEQHMTVVPEYRVLVAIDRLIKDVNAHFGLSGQGEESVKAEAAATDQAELPLAPPAAEAEPEAAMDAVADEPAEAEHEADADVPAAPEEAVAANVVDLDDVAPPLAPVDIESIGPIEGEIVALRTALAPEPEEIEDDLIVAVKAEA